MKKVRYGSVTGPHPATVKAGMTMLRQGGSAIDAAIAAAFTEGVVNPVLNGIAGYGGAMVLFLKRNQKVVAIDYNCRAPASASEDMYPRERVPGGGTRVVGAVHARGAKAIAVPGTVAGLCTALKRFGQMPLRDVIQPAIRAARNGFVLNQVNRGAIFNCYPQWQIEFPETARVLLKNGAPVQPGEKIRVPELARTLDRIAEEGAAGFYRGPVARMIADYIQCQGGLVTREDLAQYRPRIIEPDKVNYRGCQIFTTPLTAGGLTTLQMLRLIEKYPVREMSLSERLHLLAETMKTCWQERLSKYGDPEQEDVNGNSELGDEVVARLSRRLARGLKKPARGKLIYPDPLPGTSHISTADVEGNMVSLTQTHGGGFGSHVVVPGTGLLFGHGMSRFCPQPGHPNSIAGGKRPLNNMCPTLVLKEGRPFATYGIVGGRTIPNNQLSFTVNLLDLGMSMAGALMAPRLHTEGAEPIRVEGRAGETVLAELQAKGHQVTKAGPIGGPGHGIVLGEDSRYHDAATDPRMYGRTSQA